MGFNSGFKGLNILLKIDHDLVMMQVAAAAAEGVLAMQR